MSMYLFYDDDQGGRQVASNLGWTDLIRWSESTGDPDLIQFFEDGLTESPKAVLAAARKAPKPKRRDVAATLRDLIDALEEIPEEAEVAYVNNGFSGDDYTDDED